MRGLRVMMPSRHSPVAASAASGVVARERHRGGDLLQQLLAVERLGEEAEHAALRGRDRVGNRAVRGEDDHRQRRVLAVDRLEQRRPSMPGMRRSVTTAAGRATAIAASAVSPLSAVRTR